MSDYRDRESRKRLIEEASRSPFQLSTQERLNMCGRLARGLEASEEDLAASLERERVLREAAEELLECARLRGDNELPHPENDPKLWTARMQDAWCELEEALTRSKS